LRKFVADGGELICANNVDELMEELEAIAGKHTLNYRGRRKCSAKGWKAGHLDMGSPCIVGPLTH